MVVAVVSLGSFLVMVNILQTEAEDMSQTLEVPGLEPKHDENVKGFASCVTEH
jgi:hypothetical protein